MKLFKRLMAGAMAIAMLSAYTVALAATNTTYDPIESGGSKTATVSGSGHYAGDMEAVFVMKLPTAASVAESLAFTVDPHKLLENSKPANALSATSGGSDDFGTVVFSTKSGDSSPNMIYRNQSEPLKVISMSSVDVTVNMLATLSDSKMKLYEGDGATFPIASGFAGLTTPNTTDHLYLGVKVDTISGGTSAVSGGKHIISGGAAVTDTKTISPLGAKKATVLKAVSENFEAKTDGSGFTTISGAAQKLTDDSWNYVEYTVMGASNPAEDLWQIDGLRAPNLTIKWVIDRADIITYAIEDPKDSATTATYTAQLNKNTYQAGEMVYVYVKPVSSTAKLKSVKFKYISVKATDGVTMDREISIPTTIVGETDATTGVTTPTAINGVYTASFKLPDNMAKPNAPAGATISIYAKPTFEITVG